MQEEGVDGLKRTCQLLRNRVEDDALSLLQEFAPWVMKKAPEEGLKLFTLSEVSTAPIASFALSLLQEVEEPQRSEFREKYIRYLVVMHHVEDAALNTEYVLNLIKRLLVAAEQAGVDLVVDRVEETPAPCREARSEIMQFLETNALYDPAAVFQAIAEKPLVFERIVVLAKLGRFREALQLVLNDLRSVNMACECCRRFSAASTKENNPWCILLELLFGEEDEEWVWRGDVTARKKSAFREAAIRVLVTNGYQIDPLLVALGAVCDG